MVIRRKTSKKKISKRTNPKKRGFISRIFGLDKIKLTNSGISESLMHVSGGVISVKAKQPERLGEFYQELAKLLMAKSVDVSFEPNGLTQKFSLKITSPEESSDEVNDEDYDPRLRYRGRGGNW